MDFDIENATLDQIDAENVRLGELIDEIRAKRLALKAKAEKLREQRDFIPEENT